jgi:putative acetyltransferase
MIVREYRKSDLPEISRLFYNTVHQINSRDYTPEQIAAWAGEIKDELFWQEHFNSYLVYVVEANHIIVGFTNFKTTGYIDCFYVHHQWQGQGVGFHLWPADAGGIGLRAGGERLTRGGAEFRS